MSDERTSNSLLGALREIRDMSCGCDENWTCPSCIARHALESTAHEPRDEQGRPMTYWGGMAAPTQPPSDARVHPDTRLIDSIPGLRAILISRLDREPELAGTGVTKSVQCTCAEWDERHIRNCPVHDVQPSQGECDGR